MTLSLVVDKHSLETSTNGDSVILASTNVTPTETALTVRHQGTDVMLEIDLVNARRQILLAKSFVVSWHVCCIES